jgi:hypothetical protein
MSPILPFIYDQISSITKNKLLAISARLLACLPDADMPRLMAFNFCEVSWQWAGVMRKKEKGIAKDKYILHYCRMQYILHREITWALNTGQCLHVVQLTVWPRWSEILICSITALFISLVAGAKLFRSVRFFQIMKHVLGHCTRWNARKNSSRPLHGLGVSFWGDAR